MDKVSRIDGREYSLIEQLPALVGEASYVVCEDAEGKRFVCPEDLWLENVPQTEQTAPVCTHSSTQEKIECFLSMFRGREELYARRYYSTKPERVAIHLYAKTSGRRGCAISENINARIVRTGRLYR